MCRSIAVLRSLDPPATDEEIVDAARQYLRKVTAATTTQMNRDDVALWVAAIARVTREALDALPERRVHAAGPSSRLRSARTYDPTD